MRSRRQDERAGGYTSHSDLVYFAAALTHDRVTLTALRGELGRALGQYVRAWRSALVLAAVPVRCGLKMACII